MTTTLTVTGRDTDRDSFVLASDAELVAGSRLLKPEYTGRQILTRDGWQTITDVDVRPWSCLYVWTAESDQPWIRSTDQLADTYLAQVRRPHRQQGPDVAIPETTKD